jgi:hypothetical protein
MVTVMRIVTSGADSGGRDLAEFVAAFLSGALPHVSVETVEVPEELAEYRDITISANGAILCVTPTSLDSDRLFVLAGLMHGAVGLQGFVVPLLLDLRPEDVTRTPLGVFQATTVERDDMFALAKDLAARSSAADESALRTAFEQGWDEFYRQSRFIPGPEPSDLIVSLAVQSRVVTFRFRPGDTDATWDDTVGAILGSLPSSPLNVPDFDAATLEALDVETSRWINAPALLSRTTTSHIGLVEQSLLDHWHGDARVISRHLRESVPENGVMDTFLRAADQLVLTRRSR